MQMPSLLCSFLQNNFPQYRGKEWSLDTMSIVCTTTSHRKFWVVDDKNNPFRDNDREGGASFENTGQWGQIEIVHFEDFIDKLMVGENKIKKCDCIVAHKEFLNTIVFLELKEYNPKYLEGGREEAIQQLKTSIDYFNDMGDFLDQYTRRIALFAYRLHHVPPTTDARNPMALIKRRIVAPQTKILGHLRHTTTWKNNVEFHELCAPASFSL